MYCKECGEQIDDDSKFCNYCGTQQSKSFPLPDSKLLNIKPDNGQTLRQNTKSSVGSKEVINLQIKYDETYRRSFTPPLVVGSGKRSVQINGRFWYETTP